MSIKNIAIIKSGSVIDISAVEELDEATTKVLNDHFNNPDELIEIPEDILPAVRIGTLYNSGTFTPTDSPGEGWAWDPEIKSWRVIVPQPPLTNPNNMLIWDQASVSWVETTV